MEMEKQKLLRDRGFGSSDAEAIAKAGQGQITDALKARIMEIKGLYTPQEVDTQPIRMGVEVEQLIAEKLSTYGNVMHNPTFVSSRSESRYVIKCHIDYEVEKNSVITWIELKTTRNDLAETAYKYRYQLQWHLMLLKEKAEAISKNYKLVLMVYNPDSEEIKTQEVSWNNELQAYIDKGLSWLAENFDSVDWQPQEAVPMTTIPGGLFLQAQLVEALQQVKRYEGLIDAIKLQLIKYMEQNAIKKMAAEGLSITYVAESTKMTFDSAKFKADNPEMYEAYKKETKTKPYVKIDYK